MDDDAAFYKCSRCTGFYEFYRIYTGAQGYTNDIPGGDIYKFTNVKMRGGDNVL